jgi:hypothetical protein
MASNVKLKYLAIKKQRKTARLATIIQLVNDNQFFLSLKTFSLVKNSRKMRAGPGLDKFPAAFFQP